MMNKTALGWDSISHNCRNLSNKTCKYLIRGFKCCNLCQTLLVKFESPVVQFSNFMINLNILLTNLLPFQAIKMSHQNLSSKCPIKMSHKNV